MQLIEGPADPNDGGFVADAPSDTSAHHHDVHGVTATYIGHSLLWKEGSRAFTVIGSATCNADPPSEDTLVTFARGLTVH